MQNLPTLDELDAEAEFLRVQIDYDTCLIFPVDQGLEYIKSMRGCLLYKKPYDKPPSIERFVKDIKATFMTKEEIQEIIVAQELLLRGNHDDS